MNNYYINFFVKNLARYYPIIITLPKIWVMKFYVFWAGICLLIQPLWAAPKSLMNITTDVATRTITVKNLSLGGDVYIIDFGDGMQEKSTTAVDYVHTYAVPGVYQVCMITQSISSAKDELQADTLCKTVEIPDVSCTALFDVQADGMTLRMTNRSVGDYKKNYWKIEGVRRWVNQSSVTYALKQPGYYTVRLIIEGKYCSSEKDTTVLLRSDTQMCAASFSFFQRGDTVFFQNLSVGQWTHLQWDFGDGYFSAETEPVHIYAHPGNFRVQLSLLDSTRKTISTYAVKLKVANEKLQYLPDFDALTFPDTNGVQFINRSEAATACTYLWSFGDGDVSTDSAPAHLYAMAGQYTVCLTQMAGEKRYTACKPVTVGLGDYPLSFSYLIKGKQNVMFSALGASDPDDVEWNFGDGTTSAERVPVHRYRYDSIYLVSLKARWGSRSEVVYQILNLTADPSKLTARFAIPNSQLKAGSKRVRYRGALSGDVSRIRFEWDFGDGNKDTINIDPANNYTADSTYTVCLKVFNDLTNDSDQYCQQVKVGNVAVVYPARPKTMWVNQHNGYIRLSCDFRTADRVRIELIDMDGRKIRNIYAGEVIHGRQTYEFNCKQGVYLIRLLGVNHADIQKLVVF